MLGIFKRPPTAHKVALYLNIYKHYLADHNLEDDSKFITVRDLIDFVDNYMEPETVDYYLTLDQY